MMAIVGVHNDVKHQTRKMHYTERVLKSSMRRTRKYQVGRGKLMNVSKPLKRASVHDTSLITVECDEHVD